ncbi:hypothetical protein SLS57_010659 [Botryosphaeria dothidea]
MWFQAWERERYVLLEIAKSQDYDRKLDALAGLKEGLETLFEDPWFSSLWTLQASYISKEIVLYTQRLCKYSDGQGSDWREFYLSDLQNFLLEVMRIAETEFWPQFAITERDADLFSSFRVFAEKSGLAACAANQPMAILAAAYYRTTERVNDRVYGIMQIFGFKLGKSRPGAPSGDDQYTLLQLEDELGAALLHHYPVLSQLHIHSRDTETRRGWRPGQWSKPITIEPFEFHDFQNPLNACQLWTELIDDDLVGAFHGSCCTLEYFRDWWKWAQANPHLVGDLTTMRFGMGLDEVHHVGIEATPDVSFVSIKHFIAELVWRSSQANPYKLSPHAHALLLG